MRFVLLWVFIESVYAASCPNGMYYNADWQNVVNWCFYTRGYTDINTVKKLNDGVTLSEGNLCNDGYMWNEITNYIGSDPIPYYCFGCTIPTQNCPSGMYQTSSSYEPTNWCFQWLYGSAANLNREIFVKVYAPGVLANSGLCEAGYTITSITFGSALYYGCQKACPKDFSMNVDTLSAINACFHMNPPWYTAAIMESGILSGTCTYSGYTLQSFKDAQDILQLGCAKTQACPYGFYPSDPLKTKSSICMVKVNGVEKYIPPGVSFTCPSGCTMKSTTGSNGYIYYGCEGCPSGYFFDTSAGECKVCSTSCPSGQVYNGACSYNNDMLCAKCSAGTRESAGSCVSCLAGTYAAEGAASCTACPAGSYSGLKAGACTSCSAGYYAASAGLGSCTGCSAGTHQASTGKSYCDQCPTGTYTGTSGQASCSNCAKGWYNAGTGASVCTSCSAGSFVGSEGAVGCSLCAAGTYSGGSGWSVCANCPTGSNSAAGSTVCICIAGYSGTNGKPTCNICGAGWYSASSGSVKCESCPAFSSSVAGSSVCKCSAGYSGTNGNTPCNVCGYNTYSGIGAAACSNCPANSYTSWTGRTVVSDCLCNTGYQKSSDGNTCDLCTNGKYMSNGNCLSCAIGTFSNSVAGYATVCTGCAVGSYAASTGLSRCTTCSTGTYASIMGRGACSACSSCSTRQLQGSACTLTSNTVCVGCNLNDRSIILPNAQRKDCRPACNNINEVNDVVYDGCLKAVGICGVFTYNDCMPSSYLYTYTTNQRCFPSGYMMNIGCVKCSVCNAGYMQVKACDVTTDTVCSVCGAGTYSGVGATACTSCGTGYYSTQTGVSICSKCDVCADNTIILGQCGGSVNTLTCRCKEGYFGYGTTGLSSCTQCTQGQYLPADSTACTDCPRETYQNETGMTFCKQCTPICEGGREVVPCTTTINRVCRACPFGYYSNTTGCFPCGKGTYSGYFDTTQCYTCSFGFTTQNTGMSACSQCGVDTI